MNPTHTVLLGFTAVVVVIVILVVGMCRTGSAYRARTVTPAKAARRGGAWWRT